MSQINGQRFMNTGKHFLCVLAFGIEIDVNYRADDLRNVSINLWHKQYFYILVNFICLDILNAKLLSFLIKKKKFTNFNATICLLQHLCSNIEQSPPVTDDKSTHKIALKIALWKLKHIIQFTFYLIFNKVWYKGMDILQNYCTYFLWMCKKSITFAQNFVICAMDNIPSFNSYIEKTIKIGRASCRERV